MKIFSDTNLNAIFSFLRYCLGEKEDMNRVAAGINWQQLFSFASKHALLGFCFDGIERLGKEYPDELKQNTIARNLLLPY